MRRAAALSTSLTFAAAVTAVVVVDVEQILFAVGAKYLL